MFVLLSSSSVSWLFSSVLNLWNYYHMKYNKLISEGIIEEFSSAPDLSVGDQQLKHAHVLYCGCEWPWRGIECTTWMGSDKWLCQGMAWAPTLCSQRYALSGCYHRPLALEVKSMATKYHSWRRQEQRAWWSGFFTTATDLGMVLAKLPVTAPCKAQGYLQPKVGMC